jgi:hypothetical protein
MDLAFKKLIIGSNQNLRPCKKLEMVSFWRDQFEGECTILGIR